MLDDDAVRSGSLEPWNTDQFTTELVDKWELSYAIISTDSKPDIVAYRIASGLGKVDGFAHTHRTMVRPDMRRRGLASALLSATLHSAVRRGYDGLTGKLGPGNETSRAFLIATGWTDVGRSGDNELWSIEARRYRPDLEGVSR